MKFSKIVRYTKMIVHRHRRMMVFSIIVVVLALILTAKHENYVRFISSDMENAKPRDVWEYVSDFSNVMKLNPTIMKFIITHESTDYKQWNYTVEYEEHLSQIPFVINKIIGDFIVDKSHSQPAIKSTHRTCFAKIYCLNTKSEMIFVDLSNGTRVVEMIKYECPWLLTKFCMNEVLYQRKEIFRQLQTVFTHTRH
ncbi:uncharacterized protein LOC114124101 isoform X1 [Aphis gossypii]|uniref:Uncharacterized protein n=1 Tax=Aphis gossypii TaxID=80765 RepID=A0A9P0NCR8_APHGO|nr:uncharacterized protein LOC114124101 isoform X1 [Aphis gossypii]CAH1710378.1 unnamed protein product [Aphis gossypii]